jgi:hypothetical protein
MNEEDLSSVRDKAPGVLGAGELDHALAGENWDEATMLCSLLSRGSPTMPPSLWDSNHAKLRDSDFWEKPADMAIEAKTGWHPCGPEVQFPCQSDRATFGGGRAAFNREFSSARSSRRTGKFFISAPSTLNFLQDGLKFLNLVLGGDGDGGVLGRRREGVGLSIRSL